MPHHKPHIRSHLTPRSRGHLFRVVAALSIALASLAFTLPASAQQTPADAIELAAQGLVRLDGIETGTLLFETDEPGWYVAAPTLQTAIDVSVSGPIARTTVSQRFQNISDIYVEGKYVFPLPEGAAVDTLRMQIGDRWIEGEVQEREEAKRIYEEAKEAGQVASLVEQQRPNVFTTSIANIAPDAAVVVQIEYQQSLSPRDGVFGLRIPLVVAPRYVPESQRSPELVLSAQGWQVDTAIDPDAATVLSPLRSPQDTITSESSTNDVTISVDLDAGFPLGSVESPHHDLTIDNRSDAAAMIEVDGPVSADRDFYLSWEPSRLVSPFSAAFTEDLAGETHYVAVLTPPSAGEIGDTRQPREVIFVQDTSSSMWGESMAQARAGLLEALDRLNPDDTFNIIEFNSEFSTFRNAPIAATTTNLRSARAWVRRLEATGGTEMYPALALALEGTPADDRLRQVIFLTDGAVSNETQMLELIASDLRDTRLFTVGIGSAPNSYFMTAAARAGRGSFVFVSDLNQVANEMQALFAKIENPAVVNIGVADLPAGVTVSPSPIPDLYTGDPIVLTVRMRDDVKADKLSLVGQRGAGDWQLDIALEAAEQRPGVSKLWAREHIRDLEARWSAPGLNEPQRNSLDIKILETALDFGLVSRLTSLVAVDVEVTRPADAETGEAQVPTSLPDGWDPDVFFSAADAPYSDGAQPALPTTAIERLTPAAEPPPGGGTLAYTGADWQPGVLIGSSLIVAGAAAVVAGRSRRRRFA